MKLKIDRIFYGFIFLSFFSINATIGRENISGWGKNDSSNLPFRFSYRELVYIHPDRRVYLAGEHVKFKVYCLEKSTSKPSRLSKVAYVEIYNQDQSTLLRSRIELINGIGTGEIYIPTSVNSGNFVIRGYTRWMRNEGPESFFHALLTVVNPFRNSGLKPIQANQSISLDYYPEGGSLIDGIPAKVVFQVKSPVDSSCSFSGKLLADDSILIMEFSPAKLGTGCFEFTPDIHRRYKIELMTEEDSLSTQPIPPVNRKGLSLRLIDLGTKYEISIFCNDSSLIDPAEDLSLTSYQKGMVTSQINFNLKDTRFLCDLEKKWFGEGVFSIQLINSKGEILKSRKGFKYSQRLVEPVIMMNKGSYENREQVIMDIANLDRGYDSCEVELSLSVSASQGFFKGNYPSLAQYVLLDNAVILLDQVESYFNGSISEVSRVIDYLLIANQKEVTGRQMTENKENLYYLPEFRGSLTTGKIYRKDNREPGSGIFGYLSIPGKLADFYVSKADNQGDILFETRNLYGNHEMIVQCNYMKDTLYAIELNDCFSDEFLNLNIPDLDLKEEMKEWLEHQSQNMQITSAYSKYKPDISLRTAYDSSAFYEIPDARYYLDDYTRFPVMEEVMREYIAGVYVRKSSEGFHFRVNDTEFDILYEENPLILLDGLPVFDADEIMALDPLRIKKIETIVHAYRKGYLECHGIVAYTSYEGDLAGYSPHPQAKKVEYEGLQVRKIYDFPDYSLSSDKRSRVPDFRNSLYWLPSLKRSTSDDGNISFYTSDDRNTYEVRLEGITNTGNIISGKATFEVR